MQGTGIFRTITRTCTLWLPQYSHKHTNPLTHTLAHLRGRRVILRVGVHHHNRSAIVMAKARQGVHHATSQGKGVVGNARKAKALNNIKPRLRSVRSNTGKRGLKQVDRSTCPHSTRQAAAGWYQLITIGTFGIASLGRGKVKITVRFPECVAEDSHIRPFGL